MFSFGEVLAEDEHMRVLPPEEGAAEGDEICDGWDVDDLVGALGPPEVRRLFSSTPPDLVLRLGDDRKVAVHRAVLSECSYFDALLNDGFQESAAAAAAQPGQTTVRLGEELVPVLSVDENSTLFLEVLRYIYCQSAVVDKDSAHEIYALAEYYGVEGLQDHCVRVLAAVGERLRKEDMENTSNVSQTTPELLEEAASGAEGMALDVGAVASGRAEAAVATASSEAATAEATAVLDTGTTDGEALSNGPQDPSEGEGVAALPRRKAD